MDSDEDFYVPPALIGMMRDMNNGEEFEASSDFGEDYYNKELVPDVPTSLLGQVCPLHSCLGRFLKGEAGGGSFATEMR